MAAGPAGDEVAGRVVDAAGAPVPEALVSIVAGTVPMPEIALMADAEGRFALRLPAGRFTLRAHGPGGSGEAEVAPPSAAEVVITVGT
jgi:hypothetical protein